MVLGAIVNGTSFFISLSVVSLLVGKSVADFCALILYPATLLNSRISARRLLVQSVGFSKYNVMSSAKSGNLSSYLQMMIPLLSFTV